MKRQIVLEETFKRLKVAEKLTPEIKPSKTVLLAGSVAYGAYYSVTPESDLELICVIDRQDSLNNPFLEGEGAEHLHSGEADIYKKSLPGYEFFTNIIFWSTTFFDKICNDINFRFGTRFSKEDLSGKPIHLKGLHGQAKTIYKESIKTKGGYFTKYPVHYIEQDLYYFAGVPVENLLSDPKVLSGDLQYVDKHIKSLWSILVERSCYETGGQDDEPFIENLLLRRNRMPFSLQNSIFEREEYLRHLFRLQKLDPLAK